MPLINRGPKKPNRRLTRITITDRGNLEQCHLICLIATTNFVSFFLLTAPYYYSTLRFRNAANFRKSLKLSRNNWNNDATISLRMFRFRNAQRVFFYPLARVRELNWRNITHEAMWCLAIPRNDRWISWSPILRYGVLYLIELRGIGFTARRRERITTTKLPLKIIAGAIRARV